MKLSIFFTLWMITAIGSVYSQNFRFALLTDLHITGDSLAANDLQRAVYQINAIPEICFVIVAGDVTEQGDRASLKKAKMILDQLHPPYYITSGNHETKWSESGATDFGRIFGSDRFRFEYNGYLFLGFNSGPVIRMAEGHIAPQDIAWVEQQLQEADPDKPVFLVTHYPLAKGDVDNWYTLTDAVRHYNIKAFLNGHYHADRLDAYDDIPAFVCRSTLRGGDRVGGYSVFEVRADSVVVAEQKIGTLAKPWGGYSLTKRYFTADTTGYLRPDFSVNRQYAHVKPQWITSLGNAIYSSPVVDNGRVYVGDDFGLLNCLHLSNGKIAWQFAADNRIIGTPAVSNGVVVFGSADGNIYGIDAKKGTQRWKITTPEAVLGAVTIVNGIAYIGCSDHTFRAIDINSGVEVWRTDRIKGYVEARPLVYEGKVIFGAWDGNLYALNLTDGQIAWKWSDGRSGMLFSPAAVWPVAANGRIFIAAPDRVLSAIDAESGKTIWRTSESTVRETVGLSNDGSKVYSKTMQDSIVCFSTTGEQAQKRWASYVGFGYEIAPSMPVVCEDVLFGSTMNGELFALDANDGTVLWRHKIFNSLISTVVPLSRTECVFTSSAGIVGRLEAK